MTRSLRLPTAAFSLPKLTAIQAILPAAVFALVYLLALYKGGVRKGALLDGDTYWHIATGRWMLEHASIPRSDPFSHSVPGSPWTAHEWLSELVLVLSHDLAGWTGVVAVTAATFAMAVALLAWALNASFSPKRVVLFSLVAVLLSLHHLLARPHILVMPLLMVWAIGIVSSVDKGKAPPLWLTGAMIVWANMHGSFTFGLLLAFVFAAESLTRAHAQENFHALAVRWACFLSLSLVAGLVTPHGIDGYLFTWHVLVNSSFSLAHIGEWSSPNFHEFQPLMLWLLGGLAITLHFGIRLPPWRLLLVLLLIYLSLKHIRYIELLGLLVPLFVAAPVARQFGLNTEREACGSASEVGASSNASLRSCVLLGAFTLVAVTALIQRFDLVSPPDQIAPSKALEAARREGVSGNVLNDYGWGGYLIYSGIPVFIDGRADIYGDALMKPYIEAMEQRPSGTLEALFEKHRITWTLLRPDMPAVGVLDRLPQWRRVYADDIAVIHQRVRDNPLAAIEKAE